MKSPFPGMDPYLEPHWLDVHTKLVAYAADSLNGDLPEELVARTEERVAIESDDDPSGCIAPDVRILETVERDVKVAAGVGALIDAPYRLGALVEPITERFIEIIDQSCNRLVSVIEFVSPTNKRGKGLAAFREKRSELLIGGVHVLEVDLVRAGSWTGLLRPNVCPRRALSTYRAVVRSAAEPGVAYLYPLPLCTSLSRLPVPLRAGDPTVELDLQVLVDLAYRNGRYARTIDYSQPCEPPLDQADAAWADEMLKAAGKR